MKKLNNYGMTLMELVVSVALISVIMIFMYKLIADVRSEKNENDKLTDNIIKISEIEVEIQNLIIKENISEISLYNGSIEFPNLTVNFSEEGDNVKIILDNKEGATDKKWTLENLSLGDYCYNGITDKSVNFRIKLNSGKKTLYAIEIPYYSSSLTTLNTSSWKACS